MADMYENELEGALPPVFKMTTKPCPFCGGEAEYGKETDEFGVSYHFVGCGCIEGCYASGSTKEEAIKAWNKRHSPWHTGKPIEDGWYLIKTRYEDKPYDVIQFKEGKWIDSFFDTIEFVDDSSVIKWQKIEK